jgi:hypothetical protein
MLAFGSLRPRPDSLLARDLWLPVLKSRHARCQLAEHELAHDIHSGCGGSDDETISKREADLSVLRRFVQIGDSGGSKASEDVGVARLQPPVVAPANDGRH